MKTASNVNILGAVRPNRRRLGVGWTRVTCFRRGSIETQVAELVPSFDETGGILTHSITFTYIIKQC